MSTCLATACEESCVDEPGWTVGIGRRAARWVALVAAMGIGVSLIALLACVPGHGRDRRGIWALRQVSRWVLRAVGVRLVVLGAPRSGPSLVVGNHISWLDVLALSASAPMRMVAKAEVGAWPVLGAAARRTGTLFLQRERLRDLPDTVAAITAALRAGSRVQVFPEATTRCGGALDPFRRAAFQAALDAGVVISPASVRYLDATGRLTTVPAFLGQETLAGSVRRVVRYRGCTVQVQWLAPIPAIAGTGRDPLDRAVVARLAQNAVARNLGIPVLPPNVGRRRRVPALVHGQPVWSRHVPGSGRDLEDGPAGHLQLESDAASRTSPR